MKGFWSTVLDENGEVVGSCSVSVYLVSTAALATIYSDEIGTVKVNPFTTDANGRYSFFAASGKYYLVFTKTGFTSWTSDYITIPDEVDETDTDTVKNKYVSNNMMKELHDTTLKKKDEILKLDNIQCCMSKDVIKHLIKNNCFIYESGKMKSVSKIFFDSTGGYYDFDSHLSFHSQRIDISSSVKPALYVQVTGKGDVTQINDYKIGIKAVAADKSDVVAATRGSLIGLHAVVIPLIARTTPSYDDAVPLAISNEGTAKGTEGIYINHNSGVSGGQDFQIGINVACNSDYGITVQGTVTTAIRIPNNKSIAARNYAGSSDYSIITLDVNDQVVIGQSGVGAYIYGNLSMGGDLYIDGVKVVGPRVTGWTAATGTKSQATFVTDSVTLPNLAARVGQIIDDLIAHGIIGT